MYVVRWKIDESHRILSQVGARASERSDHCYKILYFVANVFPKNRFKPQQRPRKPLFLALASIDVAWLTSLIICIIDYECTVKVFSQHNLFGLS